MNRSAAVLPMQQLGCLIREIYERGGHFVREGFKNPRHRIFRPLRGHRIFLIVRVTFLATNRPSVRKKPLKKSDFCPLRGGAFLLRNFR